MVVASIHSSPLTGRVCVGVCLFFYAFQASDFATLAKASSATPIMNEEPPEGCAVHIIDDQSQVCVCGCFPFVCSWH